VIRNVLATLQLIRMPADGSEEADSDALPGTLGDFRLIREIGRGGMGVVYEAEQVSLGRRVALKVLPFAATMDSRHLQRFKNEAHAAAQLHHTNIVPVYFVGCERGVHFYAMQYIEGHSLAELIAELRGQTRDAATRPQPSPSPHVEATVDAPAGQVIVPDSTSSASRQTKPIAALSTVRSAKDAAYFRAVAELGIHAAEALDFAHEHGVIHRDIKPANLLVDAESRLWVTDFGLAQVQGDARMTMTGDLVGTLRYMSPEQALAKRVVVDHRTDIYSLGATLYELLTLEPAFTGTDRQELLRQIAFEEPRRPRRVHPAIPAELGTIVLKALEKNPTDRYATAQHLGDDLRRFLEDRPVLARRPSLRLQMWKWARRHPAVVRAAAVILLVVVVALGVSAMLVTGAWHSESKQRHNAEAQWQRAEGIMHLALKALHDTYTGVSNLPTADIEVQKWKKKFVSEMLEFYQRFALENERSATLDLQIVRATGELGSIESHLQEYAEAEKTLRRSIELAEQRTQDWPGVGDFLQLLGYSWNDLAKVLLETGRPDAAEEAAWEALRWKEKLADLDPKNFEYQRAIVNTLQVLIPLLGGNGRRQEAEPLWERLKPKLEAYRAKETPPGWHLSWPPERMCLKRSRAAERLRKGGRSTAGVPRGD
jgi:serine/threonine protein kinase